MNYEKIATKEQAVEVLDDLRRLIIFKAVMDTGKHWDEIEPTVDDIVRGLIERDAT